MRGTSPRGHNRDAQTRLHQAQHCIITGNPNADSQRAARRLRRIHHQRLPSAMGVQSNKVVLGGLAKPNRLLFTQRMAGRYNHRHLVVPVVLESQSRSDVPGCFDPHVGNDPEIDQSVRDGLDDGGSGRLGEIDLDLRMGDSKSTEVLGEKLHDGCQVGHHPHMSAHALRVLCHVALQAIDAAEDGSRVMQ